MRKSKILSNFIPCGSLLNNLLNYLGVLFSFPLLVLSGEHFSCQKTTLTWNSRPCETHGLGLQRVDWASWIWLLGPALWSRPAKGKGSCWLELPTLKKKTASLERIFLAWAIYYYRNELVYMWLLARKTVNENLWITHKLPQVPLQPLNQSDIKRGTK